MACADMWTYRLRYSKVGRIRFISHLDVMRALKRALHRADVPVAYTAGFNPRPRISMGPPLPLGYESMYELADIVLEEMLSPHALRERLGGALPEGLDLVETAWVPKTPRLSDATSACYMIELPEGTISETAEQLTAEFMSKESALVERVRERETRVVDVRRFVRDAELRAEGGSLWLWMEISLGQQGTCNPSEVIQAVCDMAPDAARCLRVKRTEIKFGADPFSGDNR
ncbi:MAG: hypothetical protein Kow0099_33070 [Candidatus Abyssubacteria bacterium]